MVDDLYGSMAPDAYHRPRAFLAGLYDGLRECSTMPSLGFALILPILASACGGNYARQYESLEEIAETAD